MDAGFAMEHLNDMNCRWCGSSSIRTSRLRLADLPRLFTLQLPMRCRSCEERYFANIFSALKFRGAEKARRLARRRKDADSTHDA
jgi:hypothetical protein